MGKGRRMKGREERKGSEKSQRITWIEILTFLLCGLATIVSQNLSNKMTIVTSTLQTCGD